MTKIINGKLYIYPSADQQCDLCGKIAELRPYGPKGECICYECGMKNEEETQRQFGKILDKATFNREP